LERKRVLNRYLSRSRGWIVLGILTIMVSTVAACGDGDDGPPEDNESPSAPGAQPLTDEAQALVNQGNMALRDDRYQEALTHFQQAMELHPDHPVPQFGGLMAAMALGDSTLTASLREKLTVTGPELLDMLGPEGTMGGGMPGAGHMPTGDMPPTGMPPGHPQIQVEPDDTVGPISRIG
jgi:hypothetical protein